MVSSHRFAEQGPFVAYLRTLYLLIQVVADKDSPAKHRRGKGILPHLKALPESGPPLVGFRHLLSYVVHIRLHLGDRVTGRRASFQLNDEQFGPVFFAGQQVDAAGLYAEFFVRFFVVFAQ